MRVPMCVSVGVYCVCVCVCVCVSVSVSVPVCVYVCVFEFVPLCVLRTHKHDIETRNARLVDRRLSDARRTTVKKVTEAKKNRRLADARGTNRKCFGQMPFAGPPSYIEMY